jgi:hypothetical protein
MMRMTMRLLALTAAIICGTVFVGWWTVPVVSGAWTLASPRRGNVLQAATAGAFAWGALLIIAYRGGPVGALDQILAQIMQVPRWSLLWLTVAFGSLLAGSSALLAQAIRPQQPPPPPLREGEVRAIASWQSR